MIEGQDPPPVKRLHESILLTAGDTFIGFTRK